MTTVIRCPDFPLTKPLRAHLMRRFSCAFRKYRDQTSLVEVSVRSTRQDAYEDADVHVHVKVELEHEERLEHHGLRQLAYSPGRPAWDTG